MHETREIVINTGPLIALTAALSDLRIVQHLYTRVLVPFEVAQEILVENSARFGAVEFNAAAWLEKKTVPVTLSLSLKNTLGPGEAAVVQWALDEKIGVVCIDETVGRRVARLHGLRVTGSLGILIRAKQEGFPVVLAHTIRCMRDKGIWLSEGLEALALKEAGEE